MILPRDLPGLRPLAPAVAELLPQQRWYAGDRHPRQVDPLALVWVRQESPAAALTVWEVTDADGATDRYHLPLGFRPATQTLPPGLEPLATEDEEGRPGDAWIAYDGLGDPELATHLLRWMDRPGREGALGATVVRRRLGPAAALEPPDSATPLGGDHTNSGVVYDERLLLKVFRRLWPGINPEVELTTALLAAGFDRIPRPLLALELEAPGGPWSLAVVQTYLRHGTDGFSLALTSLRDLFGDIRFEADGAVPMPGVCEEAVTGQGGSFETDAERLGVLTAAMHRALAAGAEPQLQPEPILGGDLDRWAAEMEAALERLLAADDPRLEALRPQADALRTAFERLRRLPPSGQRIRLHGDFHLGQLLRVDDGWTVLDFEGEPARPIAERRAKRSPLQDVAGVLRSFDYAAAVAVRQQAAPDEPRWNSLVPFGRTWAKRNRSRFLAGYLTTLEGSDLLPRDPATVADSLAAFQLGKALYEVSYELAHRPDWAVIPLADIADIARRRGGPGDTP